MSDPTAGRVELPEPDEPRVTDPGSADQPADPPSEPASSDRSGRTAGEQPQPAGPGEEAEAAPVPAGGPAFGSADYRMALVSAINVSLPTQHPTVVLRETESPRRQLSFAIALPDGVMLSHALRRIPTPRPLTHELLSSIIQGFDIDVVAVRLVGRQGAVYFAELDLRGKDGRSVYSCRPSDALTVALLQPVPVPILIDSRLFEQGGDVTPPGPSSPVA